MGIHMFEDRLEQNMNLLLKAKVYLQKLFGFAAEKGSPCHWPLDVFVWLNTFFFFINHFENALCVQGLRKKTCLKFYRLYSGPQPLN